MKKAQTKKAPIPLLVLILILILLFAFLGLTSAYAKGPERTLLTLSEALADSDYDTAIDCLDAETQEAIRSSYQKLIDRYASIVSLVGIDIEDADLGKLISKLHIDLSGMGKSDLTAEITDVTYEGGPFVDFLNRAPLPLKRGLLNLCAKKATVSMTLTSGETSLSLLVRFVNEGHSTWRIHVTEAEIIEDLKDFFGAK